MKFINKTRSDAPGSGHSTAVPSANQSLDNTRVPASSHGEKHGATGKIPNITFRTVIMTVLVAMGGFIFGYDTGQISGFLEMEVFLEMFGQAGPVTSKSPSGYYFTNVRSGLIVGMVCLQPHSSLGPQWN